MASTSKCPFCDGTVGSDEKNCPHCGASNENYVVDTPRQIFLPKTIEELKEYCAERGMPLLRMRFFVGENYKEPRAFGIYRDGDRFIVYKNKTDGSRSIRYQGPDEAFAVNELFQKLLSECHNRGIYPDGKPFGTTERSQGRKRKISETVLLPLLIFGFIGLIMIGSIISIVSGCVSHKADGYYRFNDNSSIVWYHYGKNWYYSDSDSSDWFSGDPGVENYSDYNIGSDFDSDWGVSDFKDSDTWDSIRSSSSSDSSSSSSDYDSWDPGDTDFDSDW